MLSVSQGDRGYWGGTSFHGGGGEHGQSFGFVYVIFGVTIGHAAGDVQV